jgi:hypothetical protein
MGKVSAGRKGANQSQVKGKQSNGSCFRASAVPLSFNHLRVMFSNLEIIGNFMDAQNAYLPRLALVRSGQLGLRPIKQNIFPLPDLVRATEYAAKAASLEIVVVDSTRSAA